MLRALSPGQVDAEAARVNAPIGMSQQLVSLLGLCKAASGEDISTLNAGTQNVNMQNTRPSMCQVSDALMCVLVCVCMCLRKTNNVKFGMQIL